jgi:hypothetical protein
MKKRIKMFSIIRGLLNVKNLGPCIVFISLAVNSYGQTTPMTSTPPDTNNPVPVAPAALTPAGTNAPGYTIAQLTNLIKAKVDPDFFAIQIAEWGVKSDVSTILTLHSNGISNSDLQMLQDAIESAKVKLPPESSSTGSVDTNLELHVRQVATMFKNDFPTTNIVAYASQSNLKLDAATVLDLNQEGVTLDQMQALEQAMASSTVASQSQTATLNMSGLTNLNLAAVTNLSMAATNVMMARTNLPVVADYAQRVATNLYLLQTNDSPALSMVTNNLENIATGINAYAAGLQLHTNFTSRPYQAFISAGAEFLNPYAISVPNPTPYGTGTLTNAGSSTVGYVEFDYINRHVLRLTGRDFCTGTNWWDFTGQWMIPTKEAPDVQFNMGFLFENGTGITNQNYSAQSLAGADFYSRLDLGFPIWRLDLPTQSHQVSFEAGGGVGTQKNFELIHPNAFVGLGYETSFRPFLGSSYTNSCGFFEAKAGAGWTDLPSLVGTNNLVNLDGNGNPKFNFRPACELSTYLAYPLTDKVYLTVDAIDYLGYRPPQSWSVKVGVSIPLDSIGNVFSSIINSVSGSQ